MQYADREQYLAYQRRYSAKHKDEQRQRSRKFYEENVELTKERATFTRKQRDKFLQEHKSSHGCSVCGESRWYCLDYHHRDPSTKSFTIGVNRRVSMEDLLAELEKCDVLCANCHRAVHYGGD
jgi:predicted HNH restriction endonuclease